MEPKTLIDIKVAPTDVEPTPAEVRPTPANVEPILADVEPILADVEEQPRCMTWHDICSAFLWPSTIICLFSIPNLFMTKDTIDANPLIPQPWRPTGHIILFAAAVSLNILIFTIKYPTLSIPPTAFKLLLSLLWQQLIANYIFSAGLSCEVGSLLIVTGGTLLVLLVDVAAGEYAWPQALLAGADGTGVHLVLPFG